MDIPAPISLNDIVTDSILPQASVDKAFSTSLGAIAGVEFEIHGNDVQVRINRKSGSPVDVQGEVAAWLKDGQLTWARESTFAIPELSGTQSLSPELITAARAIYGHAPAFIAPQKALVIIKVTPDLGAPREDLIAALPSLPPNIDVNRAIASYAAFRGLGIFQETDRIALSDGTSISLRNSFPYELSGGLSMQDVRSDAVFFSAEHQLLFDALSPTHQVSYNPETNSAQVDGIGEVTVLPLATIENGTWTWAVSGEASQRLRQFGIQNGLLKLLSPAMPISEARELDLISIAKPVLHFWTHIIFNQFVLLIDHPRLHLPPASYATVDATLHERVSADIDINRAIAAYAAQRGLPFDGKAITVDQKLVPTTQ